MNNINFPNHPVLPIEVRAGTEGQNGLALRLRSWSVAIVVLIATGMMAGGGETAYAQTPPLSLTLAGSQTVQAGKPLDSLQVRLVNPGKEAADSRLRLFIHDQEDRDVDTHHIKIAVLEKTGWRELSVEMIDGGVMAAIGEVGGKADENHQKGGFPIATKATQVWQIRLTLRLPGQYTFVVAVSPDNGSTHLAQPASMKIEAL